jgi:DNA-binding NarL/FixJ family response regulator
MSVRVAIVEDDRGVRENLALLIGGAPGFACVSCCQSAEEAWKLLPAVNPDVVLMDIHLPGTSGIDCVAKLKSMLPRTQVIMLTIEEDSEQVFDSMKAGATGYLVKHVHPQEILDAILEVNSGGAPMSSHIARKVVTAFRAPAMDAAEDRSLSLREQEVLRLLAKGHRSKEIAQELGVALGTVNTHVRHIYEKLHVRSRAQAVAQFSRR